MLDINEGKLLNFDLYQKGWDEEISLGEKLAFLSLVGDE